MSEPLDFAVVTRPTPQTANVLISELSDIKKTGFGEVDYPLVEYGTEHPNQRDFAGFRLCKEEVVDGTRIKRWWATEFSLENGYNYGIEYEQNDPNYPKFSRRYTVLRVNYAALSTGGGLRRVMFIKVTSGGSGYDSPPTVTIAAPGGGGTTATAISVINPITQKVVWIVMTNEGTGYTSAPTVTIAAPTSGSTATAAAKVQPDTCKLTQQRLVEFPDDDPRRSIFVMVDLLYETLPGPWQTSQKPECPEGVEITTWRRKVDSSVLAPVVGQDFLVTADDLSTTGRRRTPTVPSNLPDGGTWQTGLQEYVIASERNSLNGQIIFEEIVETSPVPFDCYTFPDLTFPFPAVYTGWRSPLILSPGSTGRSALRIIFTDANGHTSGLVYMCHRTQSVRGALLRKFGTEPSMNMPPEFGVRTDGPASLYIRQISENTMHPQITVNISGAVEYIPASVPAPATMSAPADQAALIAFDATTLLPKYYLLKPYQKLWKGEIWERGYLIVSEIYDMETEALAGTFSGDSPNAVNIDTFLAGGYHF